MNQDSIPSRDFSVIHSVKSGSGAHPVLSSGHKGLFPWGQNGWGADHPAPSCAKIKNTWNYNSIPSYIFMEGYAELVK
jgi:hypothetical protein